MQRFGFRPSAARAVTSQTRVDLAGSFSLLTLKDRLEKNPSISVGVLAEEPHREDEVASGIEGVHFVDEDGAVLAAHWHLHGLFVLNKSMQLRRPRILDELVVDGT